MCVCVFIARGRTHVHGVMNVSGLSDPALVAAYKVIARGSLDM